jgi:hypothetical protein
MKQMIERMLAKMDKIIEDTRAWRKEMKADRETTEARLDNKEPNPEEMETGSEHWEVPKVHASVKPVGELKKRHKGRKLPAERWHKRGPGEIVDPKEIGRMNGMAQGTLH